jgi:ferredoxin
MKQGLIDWLARDGRGPLGPAKRALVPLLYRGPMRVSSWRLTPSFSHRYGAVAAGLGVLGWSGNVLHPEHGARMLFNTVLTSAELTPSPMLDRQLCDGCRLCVRACQSGFIHPRESDSVTIGGRRSEHNRKASNLRCILVCGGFSGTSRYPGWSTWSEGRVTLPDDDADLQQTWDDLLLRSLGRGSHGAETFARLVHHSEYGFVHRPEARFESTCGYCQYVCAGEREERKALYEALSATS